MVAVFGYGNDITVLLLGPGPVRINPCFTQACQPMIRANPEVVVAVFVDCGDPTPKLVLGAIRSNDSILQSIQARTHSSDPDRAGVVAADRSD